MAMSMRYGQIDLPRVTWSVHTERISMSVNRKKLLSTVSAVAVAATMTLTSAAASQSGQAEVEINGSVTQITGHCVTNDTVMQFWSDGNDAPAQKDLNGDGAYLDILVHSALKSLKGGAMVQLMSGDEWIYKGIAQPANREGAKLSFEHNYTRRESKGGGDFEIKVSVTCEE